MGKFGRGAKGRNDMAVTPVQTIVLHALAKELEASLNAIYELRYFNIRNKTASVTQSIIEYRGLAMGLASTARPIAAEYIRTLFSGFKSTGLLSISMTNLNSLSKKLLEIESDYHSFMTTPIPQDEPSQILLFQFKAQLNSVIELLDGIIIFLSDISSTDRALLGVTP